MGGSRLLVGLWFAAAAAASIVDGTVTAQSSATPEQVAACEALSGMRNLTITSATVVETRGAGTAYCYVKGALPRSIRYHVQLPFAENWNGRFLQWGDGGKDGDLDFADHRVEQGYAVANSNTGHDNGAEPGASFAFNNRQGEIDFGYRAVHLTVNAGKTLVRAYYGEQPEYAYFEGCSTGGRQGLMEAQRYPYDFQGIVAGAPVNYYQAINTGHIWNLQSMFRDEFAGALSFDTTGDGSRDSVRKTTLLAETVLAKCDANDGITDGVIDDPMACDFDPDRDLAGLMCTDRDKEDCFTPAQLQTVKDFYRGPDDSAGRPVYYGKALGSEMQWLGAFVPHAGNNGRPGAFGPSGDHLNYLFYETDPGVPMPNLVDLSREPDTTASLPEWAWWHFNIDDVTAGKGDLMMSITDATDADLSRFLLDHGGKLLLYHGWSDTGTVPAATVAYYDHVVETTFDGQLATAREHARLFLAPGMGHCGGGPGPNTWDKLDDLVAWVERGDAPDAVIATHRTDGVVDNERPLCAYPERAVYTGPAGGANDPVNWVQGNFSCR